MLFFFFLMIRPPPRSTLFPSTTLFRSLGDLVPLHATSVSDAHRFVTRLGVPGAASSPAGVQRIDARSEEHTSELQSHSDLVCRLLLEKKKKIATVKSSRPTTAN